MARQQAPQKLLEHPVRQLVADEVRRSPGVSFTELQERIASAAQRPSFGNGTLSHHLYRLERAKLIISRRAGRSRAFFLPEQASFADQLAIRRTPVAARILELARGRPDVGQQDLLASMPGVSRQSVWRCAKILRDRGLLVAQRSGRTMLYRCGPHVIG